MKTKLFLISGAVLMLFFVFCCKSEKEDAKEEQQSEDLVEIKDTISDIIYVLPSPNEILAEIFIEDIKIDPTLVNSYTNANQYIENRSKAINLGVYIADFAYLSYSPESTTELNYLKVIKKLTEEVNIYGLMENKTLERIQDNLTEKDSLNKISQELYYKISNNLENSDRENLFTLISSGAIIESLYLSVMLVDDFNDYKGIIEKMYEQKFVFDNFYEYASVYADDPYVKQIMDKLEILKQTFDQLNTKETEHEVIEKDDQTLRFTGGSQFIVNSENFKKFKTDIISIRNDIITP
ncbi:MAG: hypothetical protein R6V23_04150 [Bacteroidales bacterium]